MSLTWLDTKLAASWTEARERPLPWNSLENTLVTGFSGSWSAFTACWLCFEKGLGAVGDYKQGGEGGGENKNNKNPS